MKLAYSYAVSLAVVFCFGNPAAKAHEPTNTAFDIKPKVLDVSVLADKSKYKVNDEIKLKVLLSNISDNDIFICGTLEWGYRASLTLDVRDAQGQEVESTFIEDATTYPPKPGEEGYFVKLLPYHFLGTYSDASLKDLNIQKVGRYAISVEYHSPLLSAKVAVKPFFGKEEGTIKSNVLWIEVTR